MVQDRAERQTIDTHVHVWPLDDAPGHQPAPDGKVSPPDAAAPVEWLLQDMAEYHVAHCVLVQSSAFGWDNTYMVECLRYPGRFQAIGLVDPESPANARALERWMDQGLTGFRFHPLYYDREPRGAWWVDAPESDDLWAAATATGAILQFHMLPQHAPALARMIERHPQVRVIVDHIGKPDVTETPPYPGFDPVLRLADYPHVYAQDRRLSDCQSTSLSVGRHLAVRALAGRPFRRSADALGHRVSPHRPARPAGGRPALRRAGATPDARRAAADSLGHPGPPVRIRRRALIAAPGTGFPRHVSGGRTMIRPRGPIHRRRAPYQALLSDGPLLRPSAAVAVSQLWEWRDRRGPPPRPPLATPRTKTSATPTPPATSPRAKILLQRTLDHGETWRTEDEVVIGDYSRPLAERRAIVARADEPGVARETIALTDP